MRGAGGRAAGRVWSWETPGLNAASVNRGFGESLPLLEPVCPSVRGRAPSPPAVLSGPWAERWAQCVWAGVQVSGACQDLVQGPPLHGAPSLTDQGRPFQHRKFPSLVHRDLVRKVWLVAGCLTNVLHLVQTREPKKRKTRPSQKSSQPASVTLVTCGAGGEDSPGGRASLPLRSADSTGEPWLGGLAALGPPRTHLIQARLRTPRHPTRRTGNDRTYVTGPLGGRHARTAQGARALRIASRDTLGLPHGGCWSQGLVPQAAAGRGRWCGGPAPRVGSVRAPSEPAGRPAPPLARLFPHVFGA